MQYDSNCRIVWVTVQAAPVAGYVTVIADGGVTGLNIFCGSANLSVGQRVVALFDGSMGTIITW